ncbi:hypothetical protein [Pseudoxanthobacter sp.]|uniref:hypothetical protein n=1 Tax=Pseudoxanthobacter sp. TaxID=1925742 RepID=UPI002FE19415
MVMLIASRKVALSISAAQKAVIVGNIRAARYRVVLKKTAAARAFVGTGCGRGSAAPPDRIAILWIRLQTGTAARDGRSAMLPDGFFKAMRRE